MKIGVIADTHITKKSENLPAEILDAFKNVDMIVHAGDLIDLSVLDKLKSACPNIKAVWGNMDPEDVKARLPQKEIIDAGRVKIGLIHGYGAPKNLINIVSDIFKQEKPDIIIFGHAHTPTNETINGVLFFNPGSPTDKIFAPYNSYGIIEINGKINAKIIKLNG